MNVPLDFPCPPRLALHVAWPNVLITAFAIMSLVSWFVTTELVSLWDEQQSARILAVVTHYLTGLVRHR